MNTSIFIIKSGAEDLVPSSAVDGLDDFSVTVWFKTSVNKSQQEIFHALGKDSNDDELEIFLSDSHAVYIKVRDNSEVLTSNIELTDGNWHHLVVTRVSKNVCLYIDGTTRDVMQCEYICGLIPGELNAVGIRIVSGGSDNQIDTISESLNIHAAWVNAGSPASGFIANSTYNVTESVASTVDRLDFGGDEIFSNFLVHASSTLSLPLGDYTIYVESDEGFSFIMDTLDGDTVTFNKFGSSRNGERNELRY
ncbi:LamG-like jellyroll fold domain-containing protein [Paraglaciecola sp. MB-3u-78]|uniref:LamG-like jellyroll fold domain-containing protein n=1 Tax=Paraglaciecola sp. MB-3u-78 TaxID=2058332 RepID=UPI001E3143AE|nr:LamG-like jellyroll fold domain-containing protein [Paraglaciecola sp. MB-3u-78]